MHTPWTSAELQAFAAVAAVLLAVGAAVVAAWQLWESRRQRKVHIGLHYQARLWEIDDALLHSPKGTSPHRRHQYRYLTICEDELDAARHRWLEEKMWKSWHGWLASSQARTTLNEDLKATQGEGQPPFNYVRECLATPENHSWKQCRAKKLREGSALGALGLLRRHAVPPGQDVEDSEG